MPSICYKPAGDFLRMIRNGENFSFARYWDGELASITGREGANCDACCYTSQLRDMLRKTITNNLPYYHALYFPVHHAGTSNLRANFEQFLKAVNSEVLWYDAMIWQRAFEEKLFNDVVFALTSRKVIFVGGPHLKPVLTNFHNWAYYEIPFVNANEKHQVLVDDVKKLITTYTSPVVIFCAGMESNCLIEDLFPVVGNDCTMLDMGSVWDAFLGLQTRKWIRATGSY